MPPSDRATSPSSVDEAQTVGQGGKPAGLMTREFATLMLASSVFFLAVGAMNVLLPKFVVDELSGTEATAGFVMGSAAFSSLLSRPMFGRIADRRGARRIIVIGAILGALSFIGFAFTESLVTAVASRLVFGASGAAFMTGATILALELAPDDRPGQAASYVLISFHAGMGLGPLIAELLVDATSYPIVWASAAAVSLLGGATAMLLTHTPGDPNAKPGPLVNKAALLPGVVTLFGVAAFNGFMLFVPLYAREVGLGDAGLAFLAASLTMVIVRTVFGRVPDIIGPVRAGSFALILTVIAVIEVAFWTTPTGLVVGAALLACGLSLQSPSFMAITVERVAPSERGSAMATFTGFYDIAGAVIGPMLGLIVAGVSYRAAFLTTGVAALIALAILHLVIAPQRR